MRSGRAFFAAGLLPLAVAISAACSAGPRNNAAGQGGDGGGNGGSGNGGAATAGGGSINTQGGGGQGGIGVGGKGGGNGGAGGSCAAVSSEAKAQLQPADIIIAVDTSGSMDEESSQVQQNLNTFATLITNSGIDVHVVLVADSTMCIPAPLGSGQCNGADEKLPGFRHVVHTVNSNDGLQVLLSTYPEWKASLRQGASKTLAIVTDDNSDMSASDFNTQLLALDPPTFLEYKFDSISSSTEPTDCLAGCFFNCGSCQNPCCDKAQFCTPLSAAKGKVYEELVQQTMGVYGDLCAQNFGPVFQDMATGIVQGAMLSCEYDIPPPPMGETLDPSKVNVNYTPKGQMAMPILFVKSPADCGAKGGWYYDDPNAPKKIIMCSTTCDILKADSTGKVDVLFGCETQIKPPE